ncbi:nijmegen breakage syndrome 1 protein isoform X2 [Neltuma alba]|uniref:nijmegen breakage syndrome 1 protein isoform X2 n=1 Tax=Neltuma alba TaxID=207710 RepID=UPI0010A59AD7|nr:nijmegen breakage syndrome 1 protein-like isoform X2 [Prosopis alba]
MVWGLFPVDPLSGEDKYYIFRCGSYKVGRKDCDVIITKDKGVSRVHAEIIVQAMTNEPSYLSSRVLIRDCSKYGTFISKNAGPKRKVHELPNKEATLEDCDLISFGTGSATYRFSHVPLVFFICSLDKADQSLEERLSSFGGRITNAIGQECTHVLVDQNMPLKDDLVDAVVARKPLLLKTWVEVVAEKNISTEIPSCNSYIPTVSVEGASVRVVDPKAREHCLKGYTFLLESVHLYKFGAKLKSLLEVAGAKIASFEEFCTDSQGLDYGEDNRVVCIIPGGPASKSDRFNKQSSLSRVNEMDITCAALSGQLDQSILISPCVLVSSSCSTDETIVADSDTEDETATLSRARETLCKGDDIKYEKADISLDVAPARFTNMKSDRRETSLDGVSARLAEKGDGKHENRESALHDASSRLDPQSASFREGGVGVRVKKDEVDDYESRSSDIIYSQDLIVRDIDSSSGTNAASNSSLPNFKRFRKVHSGSGNSFTNLVPFAKYPYKDSDYENDEINKSIKEEKKRKKMEAIAEDLFNNEKARKRGAAGSLRSILIS